MSRDKDRMTFQEACEKLRLSEEELEKLVAAGEIASIKEGDTFFFKPEVVEQLKQVKKTEPTIILSDDELDLLDGVEDINLDDLDLGDDDLEHVETELGKIDNLEPTGVSADSDISDTSFGEEVDLEDFDLSDFSLDDDDENEDITAELATEPETSEEPTASADMEVSDEINLEEDISLDGFDDSEFEEATEEISDETVLNLDGLLDEEDGAESTTPIPGTEIGDLDLDLDITLEGAVPGDETILDTDILDLSDEEDFDFDQTTDGEALDATVGSTLIRGGGARVMQMKRVKGHPTMTAILLLTAIALILPMAVLINILYFDKDNEIVDTGGMTSGWIKENNYLKSQSESSGDFIFNTFSSSK